MKKRLSLLMGLSAALFLVSPAAYSEEDIYYARCNLKVLEGNEITWINWQSAPTFIPAGTKLKVSRTGSKAFLVNVETNSSYTLDIGAEGMPSSRSS